MGWDQPLSGELLRKWLSLSSDLLERQTISIPRYYLGDIQEEADAYSLCGFCDDSTNAYAAVVYLLVKTGANIWARFIASKTRVVPLCTQTIPRLELLSVMLLARLVRNITHSLESQLPLTQPTCFTDSKVAPFLNLEYRQGLEAICSKPCVKDQDALAC